MYYRYVFEMNGEYGWRYFDTEEVEEGKAKALIESMADGYKLVSRDMYSGILINSVMVFTNDIVKIPGCKDLLRVMFYSLGGFGLARRNKSGEWVGHCSCGSKKLKGITHIGNAYDMGLFEEAIPC
jgi:hypothetical protein